MQARSLRGFMPVSLLKMPVNSILATKENIKDGTQPWHSVTPNAFSSDVALTGLISEGLSPCWDGRGRGKDGHGVYIKLAHGGCLQTGWGGTWCCCCASIGDPPIGIILLNLALFAKHPLNRKRKMAIDGVKSKTRLKLFCFQSSTHTEERQKIAIR